MGKVWVVGSSNIDMIFNVPCLPSCGETVLASALAIAPGGKGFNQAVAAHRSGAQVVFVGCVGNDAYASLVTSALEEEGIQADALKNHPAVPTGMAIVYVDTVGRNTIVVSPGANMALTAEEAQERLSGIEAGDWVLSQLELPPDTVRQVFKFCKMRGVNTVLNYSPVVEAARDIISLTDLLIVNEVEAQWLSGLLPDSFRTGGDAARLLSRLGPEIVVITLGALGSVVYRPDQIIEVCALKVDAVDTQGAGDAFTGVLVGLLAQGHPLDDALDVANWAAGQTVCRPGSTRLSMPSKREISDCAARFVFRREDRGEMR